MFSGDRMKLYPKSKAQWIRLCVLASIALFLFSYKFLLPLAGFISYEPQDGDILFQPLPGGELARAIEGATHSP
jgi:hypothetical protein